MILTASKQETTNTWNNTQKKCQRATTAEMRSLDWALAGVSFWKLWPVENSPVWEAVLRYG